MKYRFFYHYNKPKDAITIHFRGKCHVVDRLLCFTECESKRNKKQPRIVMQGWANRVDISKDEDKLICGVIL